MLRLDPPYRTLSVSTTAKIRFAASARAHKKRDEEAFDIWPMANGREEGAILVACLAHAVTSMKTEPLRLSTIWRGRPTGGSWPHPAFRNRRNAGRSHTPANPTNSRHKSDQSNYFGTVRATALNEKVNKSLIDKEAQSNEFGFPAVVCRETEFVGLARS
jgi:hypothetical protein